MLRLGGAAHPLYIDVFRGLQVLFRRQGIDLDWVLYSDWDALVDAFVRREVDLAWNGPLAYVKIKKALNNSCQNLAMRDVDRNFITHFITQPGSNIAMVTDLQGKAFAFGSRGSIQAGVLAYHFLREAGIDPKEDLARFSFHDQRQPSDLDDERDVIERVQKGEYDAGAVCQFTLGTLKEQGLITDESIRVFWSSPGYSHCCFTAHSDLDPELSRKVTAAFVSIDASNPAGKVVLEGEDCKGFVPGVSEGWETLERVAEKEGLI